ncbi:MAG: DUF4382 domain-containing protein [Nitrospirae bacterium]|nr:DUF4382 domain-containing protein [Nitrospirota bacterium]
MITKGKKIFLLLGAVSVALILAYCSGGGGGGGSSSGGGDSTSSAGKSVGVYLTDSPADQFPAITVTVYEINLCSDNNCATKENLYINTTGLSVDLAKLNGVLQLITTATFPEGTFNRLEIIPGNRASITDNSGVAHDAFFSNMDEKPNKPDTVQCPADGSNKCFIRFNGAVQPLSSGKLVVDFVLKEFEVKTHSCTNALDTSSWCITEVKMQPITFESEIEDSEFDLHGTLTNIGTGSITVKHMSTDFTVNLTGSTICEVNDINYSGAANCVNALTLNSCIEVETTDDLSSTTTITATRIEAKTSSDCEGSGTGEMHQNRELRGTVTKGAADFTLDTDPATLITVTDNTVCKYTQSQGMGMMNMSQGAVCFNDLQTGWTVEVKINNSTNEAIKIEREQ